MSDILNEVKKLFDDVSEAAAPVVEKAKEKLSDLEEKAAPVVEQAKAKIMEAAEQITGKDSAAHSEEVKNTASVEVKAEETAAKPEGIGGVAAPIIEKTKEVWQDISEKAAPTIDKVKDAVNSAADEVSKNVKKATDYLQGVETPFTPKNDFFDGLEQEAKDVLSGVEEKADKMGDMLHDLMNGREAEPEEEEKPESEEENS